MGIKEKLVKLKENKYVSEFLSPKTLKQFAKYIITGVLSAGIELSLLYVITEFAGFWYIISNTIAYIGGFCVSFLLNKYWSFNSRENFGRQLIMYGILFLINLALSNTLLYLATSIIGIQYMISKVFVMGIIVLWNFIIYKKIIYR